MLDEIQEVHEEWAAENFEGRETALTSASLDRALKVAQDAGKIAHHVLKADQGIRGELEFHRTSIEETAFRIQERLDMNILKRQDGSLTSARRSIHTALGVIEEAGELAEALIAGDETEARDAVGDVMLYLMDFCNTMGWSLQTIASEVASEVHERDWNTNPVEGT